MLNISDSLIKKSGKSDTLKMILATSGPKIPENGPEPEFLQNFEPRKKAVTDL
jgi:hypothetical protein